MKKLEPVVYTVEEIYKMLKIGKNQAYDLVKNDPPFRVVKVGKSYRVPKESFESWLDGGTSVTEEPLVAEEPTLYK